jgi:methionyl aminopeptidase
MKLLSRYVVVYLIENEPSYRYTIFIIWISALVLICILSISNTQAGAYPSPLNYHGFPKSCCTSVNEVICHGIPDDRKLEDGDVINLDITTYLDGYHGDCSEMFVAGTPSEEAKNLLQTTYDCWIMACQFVKPGNDYKDIGAIIEDHIVPKGFSTVRNFCGHGIGSVFHTSPNILHYRNNEPNGQMAERHTFTIEPMICEGSAKVLSWPDDWTATTIDGKRSAQFEHTLLVTKDGVEALTGKNENSKLQFWEQNSLVHKGFFLGTSEAAVKRAEEINAKLAL